MDSQPSVVDELAGRDNCAAQEKTSAFSSNGGRCGYDSQRYVPKTALLQ
jgi:hypothetical protein